MSFQWLQMRITEEQDRRERERIILERMPRAFNELFETLTSCIEAYNQAFGTDAASLRVEGDSIHLKTDQGEIEIATDLSLPGFRIGLDSGPLLIQVGMLPGDKLFYRDEDKYLTAEEMTRRILDKPLFPKLGE